MQHKNEHGNKKILRVVASHFQSSKFQICKVQSKANGIDKANLKSSILGQEQERYVNTCLQDWLQGYNETTLRRVEGLDLDYFLTAQNLRKDGKH